ncbi:TPA: hypothetical protein ACH3X2_002195 [Trebouxia sp. C0005]
MTKIKRHSSDRIHWTSKTTSISEQLEYLEDHIAEDWHDGWQAQCDVMCMIAGDICDWLKKLFKIAADRGVKLAEVQECLMFMEESIMQMINNRSRTKCEDCTDATTDVITNSKGDVCYKGPPEWKDAAVVEAFKAYRQECQELIEDKTYHDKVMLRELLDVTRDPDNPQRIEDKYGIGFQDEWHTDTIKAALPELRALLT